MGTRPRLQKESCVGGDGDVWLPMAVVAAAGTWATNPRLIGWSSHFCCLEAGRTGVSSRCSLRHLGLLTVCLSSAFNAPFVPPGARICRWLGPEKRQSIPTAAGMSGQISRAS